MAKRKYENLEDFESADDYADKILEEIYDDDGEEEVWEDEDM